MQNQTQGVVVTVREDVISHHFFRGALVAETSREPRAGRSTEEIVRGVRTNPTTYAFHVEKVYETTARGEEGQSVHLVSRPESMPLTSIGGVIYTQDALLATHPENRNFSDYLAQLGSQVRAIYTRTGHWLPLWEDERSIAENEER